MEQLDFNILYRWFVGLSLDAPVWDVTVFTKNRERLLAGDIAQAFFAVVVKQAQARQLLSPEHFTVDGTLIEAWAGLKSFKRRDTVTPAPDDPGNPTVDFHGERRSNATHISTTDPEARLMRNGRGREAKLSYHGHVLMENRHGLAVGARVTLATGTAEREAAVARAGRLRPGVKLGADKGYDARDFVAELRAEGVTPHVAQNTAHRRSAIDGRTTRHPGYAVSQQKRKLVEEIFGWLKTIALLRKTRHRGVRRGRVDVHVRGGRVQPGPNPQPDLDGSRHMTHPDPQVRVPLTGQGPVEALAQPCQIASGTIESMIDPRISATC
jgi:IS5 family transposase